MSKLEKLYRDRKLLASKAQAARDSAFSYSWEYIIPQWEKLLQSEVERRKSFTGSCIQNDRIITIPVTLPLARSKGRTFGYVYAASERDVPVILELRRIFPGLTVWSTIPLHFGSGIANSESLQTRVVQADSPEYRPHLAMSTLALDLASFDHRLPTEAAKLGIPCIGLTQQKEQASFWPNLSLEKPDPLLAVELGRQVLIDQGAAEDMCMSARQRLAETLTSTVLA